MVVENITDSDVENLIKILTKITDEGKDLDNFLWEVIKYIKDILVYKATGDLELYNKEEKEKIDELSKKVTKERLLELIYMLSELANTMKWSTQKVIMVEAGLIKACMGKEESLPNSEIKKPKETKKDKIEPEKIDNEKVEEDKIQGKTEETKKVQVSEEESKEDSDYLSYWSKILETLKGKGKVILYTNLIGTKAKKVSDGQIEIEFENKMTPFAKSVLEQEANREEITKLLTSEEGSIVKIKYVNGAGLVKQDIKQEKPYNDYIGIPINIIDE
jgi:DNA polymerase-3 subunit gamma/tau